MQKDPLQLSALEEDRFDYHWAQISNNKRAFDDYTNLTRDEFNTLLTSERTLSWEIGRGIGLCSLVFLTTVNPVIQMVMYDYMYRIYLASTLCLWAFELGATRVSSFVTEDRHIAKDYVRRVGAEYEGTLRKAYKRGEKILDVEIYGLMKEKFVWQQSQL
jgi:hypothetical protein